MGFDSRKIGGCLRRSDTQARIAGFPLHLQSQTLARAQTNSTRTIRVQSRGRSSGSEHANLSNPSQHLAFRETSVGGCGIKPQPRLGWRRSSRRRVRGGIDCGLFRPTIAPHFPFHHAPARQAHGTKSGCNIPRPKQFCKSGAHKVGLFERI